MSHIADNTSCFQAVHVTSTDHILIACTRYYNINVTYNLLNTHNSEPIHTEIINNSIYYIYSSMLSWYTNILIYTAIHFLYFGVINQLYSLWVTELFQSSQPLMTYMHIILVRIDHMTKSYWMSMYGQINDKKCLISHLLSRDHW